MAILKRGSTYYLRRRVPVRYAKIEKRSMILMSLHTDSEKVAREKEASVWEDLETAWEAELNGAQAIAKERFEAAKKTAENRGFLWMPTDRVAKLSLGELLDRVEATRLTDGRPDQFRAEAMLGLAEIPKFNVSTALEEFWTLAADKTRGMSDDQIRRWKNPRIKAVNNFISVCGDLEVESITADNMLDFRQWWWERVEVEGLTPNSANKDFVHLGQVLKTVCQMKRLNFRPPIEGLSFREDEKGKRPSYSEKFIREKILAPGALDGLNADARLVLLGMVNTGYRPSEGANLQAHHIILDQKIPYIDIVAEGRRLKTRRSKRLIPLTGVSLEVFREMPSGAERYRDKPGLSATLNKFLRANGLVETPKHTVYSLRHGLEDRMLIAGVDERVRRDVLGHALDREEYGEGGGLAMRRKALLKVAL